MSPDQTHAEEKTFLQKDYELKVTYLSNQFTRMWNRFNYFVTIETALIGGNFLIPNGRYALAFVGILMSFLWYIMGAEDRYLVRLYRHQIKKASEEVAATIWTDMNARENYCYVGQVDEKARKDLSDAEGEDSQGIKKSRWKRIAEFEWLSGWRWEPISTTRLAALFPLLVLVLWVIILILFTR